MNKTPAFLFPEMAKTPICERKTAFFVHGTVAGLQKTAERQHKKPQKAENRRRSSQKRRPATQRELSWTMKRHGLVIREKKAIFELEQIQKMH